MSKKLSEILDLHKAYSEVLDSERRGKVLIPDVINHLDSQVFKDQILGNLKIAIDEGGYCASSLIKMDIPKDTFFIRPAALPSLEDCIIYQAIAGYIGLKVDRKLSAYAFSYRFDRRSGKVFHWAEQWLKFENAFWRNYKGSFKYVLKTDITSYFANISIERLRSSILALSDHNDEMEAVIELLFNSLLRPWSEREVNKHYGLPQGAEASRILGNLFLAHIDALFVRDRRYKYFRYMDDIRILAKTEAEAKLGLKNLIRGLRDIGLDLNEKKTEILEPPRVEQELRNPRAQDQTIIQNAINKGNETIIRTIVFPLLEDLFNQSFNPDNKFSGRHLRFCVNCYIRLREIYSGNDQVIKKIGLTLVERLESTPGSAYVFTRFFSVFPINSLKKPLFKLLRSDNNIYDWQEMWILDSLLRFQSFVKNELEMFRTIAFNRDKHPLVRSKAVLLLGKFGNSHERWELRRIYNEETETLVKRAIIIATQQLSIAERKEFYASVKRSDNEHARLIEYLNNIPSPVYFDKYIPSPITIVEEQS